MSRIQEYVIPINPGLVSLENFGSDRGRAALFTTLFSSAYSLKGALRVVKAERVEVACHRKGAFDHAILLAALAPLL